MLSQSRGAVAGLVWAADDAAMAPRKSAKVEAKPLADHLLSLLGALGVDVVFGYPGGAVLPLYDALARQSAITHILVRHEQAAVHAATAWARVTGRPGVVFATSGPGATNLVTGMADAMADGTPLLVITGQVGRPLLGTDAFQEANVVSIMRPVTKHNCLLTRADELPNQLAELWQVACEGRPGPVALDIPKDVQAGLVKLDKFRVRAKSRRSVSSVGSSAPSSTKGLRDAANLLATARRPMLYIGGGVSASGDQAVEALGRLAERLHAPVGGTLMGLGAFPASHPNWLGMLGMHGTYEANLALHDCDVMLCVGARFDDRVTGRLDGFSPKSRKIHIDLDPVSLNKLVEVDVALAMDAGLALTALDALLAQRIGDGPKQKAQLKDWWQSIAQWRARHCLDFDSGEDRLLPQAVLTRLNDHLQDQEDVLVTTDVGQHQMWAAQYLRFDQPRRWLTSGGLGTMGFGLPAALGAQLAMPAAKVIAVSGDASFQMNIQELATVRQYGLPIKIIILNNGYMGMVRQWQDLHHGGRHSQSYCDALPDFAALARVYGLEAWTADCPASLARHLPQWLAADGPALINCLVSSVEDCYPMIPAGAAHNQILLGPGCPDGP